MSMTQIKEPTLFVLNVDLGFPMPVGAGCVDPRLVEPLDHVQDIEELIAFRTSCL